MTKDFFVIWPLNYLISDAAEMTAMCYTCVYL